MTHTRKRMIRRIIVAVSCAALLTVSISSSITASAAVDKLRLQVSHTEDFVYTGADVYTGYGVNGIRNAATFKAYNTSNDSYRTANYVAFYTGGTRQDIDPSYVYFSKNDVGYFLSGSLVGAYTPNSDYMITLT